MAGPLLRWVGAPFAHHSLSYGNREIVRRLVARGVDVEVVSVEPAALDVLRDPVMATLAGVTGPATGRPEAVHVRHQWPPDLVPPAHGAWVMCQPWEFGGLPAAWLPVMRDEVDEVWAYTSWLRDCYVESGVAAEKVHVTPLGVDTARFRPGGPRFPLGGGERFRFLFVGGTIGRKGIDVLVQAYVAAFTAADDVTLIIKGSGSSSFYAGSGLHEQLAELRRGHPNAPHIEYLDLDLGHDELAALYRSCDALVHPYRGEGFGLPVAEAMASGLPVVVTGYGACLDFCDADTAYLLPARTVPVAGPPDLPPSDVGYWWAEPDVAALVDTLRRLVADPAAARVTGERGRQRISTELTWERTADAVGVRVDALVARGVGRRIRSLPAVAAPAAGERVPAACVSIVVAAVDAVDALERCLVALAPSVPDGSGRQVVVVDGGSTDATPALLACLEGDVVTAVLPRGTAPTAAWQHGVELAAGETVVLVDPSVELSPDWLEPVLAAMGDGDAVAVVAGDGAVVASRASAVDAAGGLDVALPPADARVDLCRRLAVRGGRIVDLDLRAASVRPASAPSTRFSRRWRHDRAGGDASRPRGVNVVGFFRGEFGVAEAARLLTASVAATGEEHATVAIGGSAARQQHDFEPVGPQDLRYDTTVVCANAESLVQLADAPLGRRLREGRTVGYWFWETEVFPDRLHDGFDHVDEVWAGSTFIQRAVQRVAPVPVHAFPPPIRPRRDATLPRSATGLPDGFAFLFMFDFLSVMARKNPLAAIDAFRLAFAPGDGVSLVIKAVNGEAFPNELARLRRAVASHPDVHLLEGYLSAAANHALFVHADAYVSLHAAEGFGLTLAEAMAQGKPVVATRYSGNLDFMDDANSVLVPYELVDIPAEAREIFPDGRWAEPDRAAAAAALQRVAGDPDWARAIGRRAAEDVARRHSVAARATQVAALLDASRAHTQVGVP